MKTLLLVFLASGPLMTPASPDPKMTSDYEFGRMCEYNEVYRATYYNQYPGGPECGLTYMYCWGDTYNYHEGCTTSYYTRWYNDCQCQ